MLAKVGTLALGRLVQVWLVTCEAQIVKLVRDIQSMANIRYIHIEHPDGWKLRDLVSIERDFRRCEEMCSALVEGINHLNIAACAIDAFATAIPIVYARPFNGGIRMRVEEILTLYSEEDKKHHLTFLNIRSKYAAHSINSMESQNIRVWLVPEERGRGIQEVNADCSSILSLKAEDYLHLKKMCQKALSWIRQRQAKESECLQNLILKVHPIDSLYAMEAQISECGGKESAAIARKQR